MKIRNLAPFQMKRLDTDMQGAIATLVEGVKTVEKHCDYWVSAGTALGILRDKELIPWDTDLDIEVMEKDLTKKLIDDLESNGFKLVRTQTDKGKIWQAAFVYTKTGFIFDIYTYVEEGEILANYNEHGKLLLQPLFVENKVEQTFGGKKMWFPSPIRSYLNYRYGPDWHTPTEEKGAWEKQAGNLQ